MLKSRATSSNGGTPFFSRFTTYSRTEWTRSSLRGRRPTMRRQAASSTRSSLLSAPTTGSRSASSENTTASHVGLEADGTTEEPLVVDGRIRAPVHELDAERGGSPVRHFPRALHQQGRRLLGVVTQPAHRGIGLAEAQDAARPERFEDHVEALVGDVDVAFDVGQRVAECRRVERNEADQAAVAHAVRDAEFQAIARFAQQQCRPFDQAHVGGIEDTAVGAGDVGPRQADLLQGAVERMPRMPQVVGDVGGPSGLDHRSAHAVLPRVAVPA